MKKPRKKVVKAWAVYRTPGKYDAVLLQAMAYGPMAIFKTREAARSLHWAKYGFCEIIPCTITYTPKKRRKA